MKTNRVLKLQHPVNLQDQIASILTDWHSDYLTLNDFLEQEQNALESRDFDRLADITAKKNDCMLKINNHDLPQDFKANSNSPIASLDQYCKSNRELSTRWNTILTLLSECQYKNEVNGRLIKLLNTSCRRVFNLLKGMDPDNNIYNSTGACSRVEATRASVSA